MNNAGGQFISAAEQITPKGFRAVMRLNLDATWYMTTQVASLSMLANGYGKVACITMTPSRGMPGMTHSSASRAAVESLVRTWAAEWASRGSEPSRLRRESFTQKPWSATASTRRR